MEQARAVMETTEGNSSSLLKQQIQHNNKM